VDGALGHMERTGVRLLWGTAHLFSHPRSAAGAATDPDRSVEAAAVRQAYAAVCGGGHPVPASGPVTGDGGR